MMRFMQRPVRIFTNMVANLIIAAVLAACNLVGTSPNALLPPTATVSVAQMPLGTAVPTLARLYQPLSETRVPATSAPELDETPEPTIEAAGCASDALTSHVVDAKIDYAAHTIEARQTITYFNRTGDALDDLVVNVEPNRWLASFTLVGILLHNTSEGNVAPTHTLTGRRLYIDLVDPLEADCALTVELAFKIVVPQMRGGVEAFDGYFGYSPRQMNLGHWLPTVAVRQGSEWITRQAMFVGEQEVIDKADWDVTLELVDAPPTLRLAAPGTVEKLDDNRWHYSFPDARDFAISLSDAFNFTSIKSDLGVTIELYTFADAVVQSPTGPIDGANHVLNLALRSFETYADLFGEYPYDRMVVVEGDFPDGMEFSGMVFVSVNWFTSYEGRPDSFLTLITIHEVAHQWWYARVGNDPAMTPWLDEALATYSEYIFIEEFYPSLKDWWWNFRVDTHSPGGFVDSTIYEFTTIREYINAVYLRGVRMLHAVRQDIGTEAFFNLLRKYSDEGAGKVVSSDFFWSLMTPEQLKATEVTRGVFLRKPNITVSSGG